MPYLRDRVIVLKKEPFREQDRLYYLFGKEYGFMTVIARGASLARSKQASHLEPFSESEVMIAKGAMFDKLAVARLVGDMNSYIPGIVSHVVRGVFADLFIRMMQPGISDKRIFHLLRELNEVSLGLDRGATVLRSRLLFAGASLKLMDLLGFAPPIEPAKENSSPLPSLMVVSFIRRSPLWEILKITASSDVLESACGFVNEALKNVSLEKEPHGASTIYGILS